MLIAFLIIYILFLAQLTLIIILLYKIRKSMQSVGTVSPEPNETADVMTAGTGAPADAPDTEEDETGPTAPGDTAENPEEPVEAELERVSKSIEAYAHGVTYDDLPSIKEKLTAFFTQFANKDYHKDLNSKDYYRFLDIRMNPDVRVVIVGDIHCDYLSLTAILKKLSVSDYDYFGKAYFVFLGDYLDRGKSLFEPLLLLADLKRILGDRMIMLKGNHESLSWDMESHSLKPRVKPHESCDCLNACLGKDESFLQIFASFYNSLPVYVYLKASDRNILLTHASVPRDVFLDSIRFDENNGEIVFSSSIPEGTRLRTRNRILQDMIWGDPKPCDEKIQVEGRFEFGRRQFERWMTRNHLHLLFRSHEEAEYGYTAFYDRQLFTVFSTGGELNPLTRYPKVEPAFCVLRNTRFYMENSFLYKVRKDVSSYCVNALSKLGYSGEQISKYSVNDEFACDEKTARDIRLFFNSVADQYSDEDTD